MRLRLTMLLLAAMLCAPCLRALVSQAESATPYEQGKAAFSSGDYSKAAELFAQADAGDPGQSDALLLEGKALSNVGRFPQAEAALRAYTNRHPGSADGFYMLGFVLHREDKAADSLRVYTQAAALSTPTADDLRIVGLDYVLLNDFPDAITWLKKATEFDPKNEQAWYSLGRCYYSQSRFEEAGNALARAQELNPKDLKVVTNLALVEDMQNRNDDADRTYRESIVLADADPHTDEWPYLNYASFLIDHDRAGEALPLLRRAVAIAPRCADCHAKLGKALAETNDGPGAVAELSQAIALSPDDPKLHYELGHVYRSLGMQDKARAELALSAKLYGTRDSVNAQ